jgi:hypothetical protein
MEVEPATEGDGKIDLQADRALDVRATAHSGFPPPLSIEMASELEIGGPAPPPPPYPGRYGARQLKES